MMIRDKGILAEKVNSASDFNENLVKKLNMILDRNMEQRLFYLH